MKYLFEEAQVVASVLPVAQTSAAVNGAAVNVSEFGDGLCIVTVGAALGGPTGQSVVGKLQESVNGSDGWADISGAVTVAITADNKTAEIKLTRQTRVASKRFVRAVITPALTAGTAPTIPVSAVFVLGSAPTSAGFTNSTTAN